MTDQRDQISFGEYLQSPVDFPKPQDEASKKLEDEKNLDEDRLQRINEIVGEYETQAKQSEEMLAKKQFITGGLAKVNAEVEALKSNPNYSLGDIEQFVTELHEDIPEDVKDLVDQQKTAETALKTVHESPHDSPFGGKKKITIDLFAVHQAELTKKAGLYKKRQMSPTAPVHERLFANALEKEARTKLEATERGKQMKFRPKINKTSTELLKTKGARPITAVEKVLYQDFLERKRRAEQVEKQAILDNINMPKSDFASEELARNKLAKDITKAYDKLVEAQPDIEGKPQILIEMLCLLGVFKELKLASDVQIEADPETFAKNLGVSIGSSPKDRSSGYFGEDKPNIQGPDELQPSQSQYGTRKGIEQGCCQKMWKILSFGGREVTKGNLTNLIHTLLTLDDSHSIETKLQVVQEAAKIYGASEADLKKLIYTFRNLTKEVKASRYLSHFIRKLKACENPREEKEARECTFVPNINKKSRDIDVTKKKERGTSQENEQVNDVQSEQPKKFKAKQRSQSPQRHEILYEHYKEMKTRLQKQHEELLAQKSKDLTFKPKISKAAEKFHEDNETRFNRLYEDSKKEAKLSMEYRPYSERIMDECTFKPKLRETSKKVPLPADDNKKVKGYEQVVQRYRTAAEEKKKLQEKIDKSSRGANYEELKKKQIKPFTFQTHAAKGKKPPPVIVEVSVMPGKTSKIPLHATDNPEEVARNFAKIYHLSKENQQDLTKVLKEQLAILLAGQRSGDSINKDK